MDPRRSPGLVAGRRRRRPPRRRRLAVALLTLTCVVVALAGWLVWRGLEARSELAAAAVLVGELDEQVRAGDMAELEALLTRLQRHTAAARSATNDPLWRAAGFLPGAGDDLRAARQLAAAADTLSRDVLPPLVDSGSLLAAGGLRQPDGGFDVAAVARTLPALDRAATALDGLDGQLRDLHADGLAAPVRTAVEDLRRHLGRAAEVTATAQRVARLLPPMLGADGPRRYLLVFQNLAELRATGGIWGAWAIVHVDDGHVTLGRQGTAEDVNDRLGDIPLPAHLEALYGDRMRRHFQNANLTPDFPTAAALARRMIRQATGVRVDGVLAADPVVLSSLLAVTGPVTVPGGPPLTADDAVERLQHRIYLEVADQEVQNLYFAAAARAIFARLVEHPGDTTHLLAALRSGSAERRLLVWSAHAAEQRLLDRTTLGGGLRTAPQELGVFLNDGTGAKMDYFLRPALAVSDSCRTEGGWRTRVSVELASVAPTSPLPFSVDADGRWGVPEGSIKTDVLVVAPHGAAIAGATVDGRPVGVGTGRDSSRHVAVLTLTLEPGQRQELRVDLHSPDALSLTAAAVRTTPVLTSWQLRPAAAFCDEKSSHAQLASSDADTSQAGRSRRPTPLEAGLS